MVLEGLEFTGGSSRCVYVHARDVVLRDLPVRHCSGQGLSADQYTGNLTLEYSEIRNSGSGDRRHALYIQSDEVTNPGSVFRMRFNQVHTGTGGNLLKSRHERNEIHSHPGLANASRHDYRPAAGSPLLAAGNGSPASPPAWPFPNPTLLPRYLPPSRQWLAPGTEHVRPGESVPTIGAVVDIDRIFANGFDQPSLHARGRRGSEF